MKIIANIILFLVLFVSISSAQEICNNNTDNDGDLLIGCADPDCIGSGNCDNAIPCTDAPVFYQILEEIEFVKYDQSTNSFDRIYLNNFKVNAVGYNVEDGFIYGVRRGTNHLVKIGNNGVFQDLGPVGSLPYPGNEADGYFVGDFDISGNLYVANGNKNVIFKIDVSSNATQMITTNVSAFNFADFSFSPATGLFYGLNHQSLSLMSFNPNTGEISNLGFTNPVVGAGPFGSSYADKNGLLYYFSNGTGILYQIDPSNMTSTIFDDTGITLSGNDGASCPFSNSLMEVIPCTDTFTGEENYVGCMGDAYAVPVGGTIFNESNPTGMVNLLTADGCDSIVTVDLTFLPSPIPMINSLFNENGYDILCHGESTGAAVVSVNGTGPYTYQWSNGATTEMINNLTASTYSVIVTDDSNCSAVQTITLNEPPINEFIIEPIAPSCSDNGSLIINLISGETAPYQYTFDGLDYQIIDQFPITINNLPTGDYEIMIEDNHDCTTIEMFTIGEMVPLEFTLTSDAELLYLGETTELQLDLNFTPSDINWTATSGGGLSCTDCLNPVISPTQSATYTVTLTDANGCTTTDFILITVVDVLAEAKVFVPNVFSLNDDGINDAFFVFANEYVEQINVMKIYDRWGEEIFSTENIPANSSQDGWNGLFRNKKLNPAVFTYFVEVQYIDGSVELLKGDVTLIR